MENRKQRRSSTGEEEQTPEHFQDVVKPANRSFIAKADDMGPITGVLDSVRVSNELGAAHPRTAKFSVAVVVVSSSLIGLVISLILIITRNQYPALFSDSTEVKQLVYELTPLLGLCIFVNNVQPVVSGVAIGAGWQAFVACVNIACYYLFGVPVGLLMGFKLKMGVTGIWWGMLSGAVVQTFVLFFMIYRTNWNKEATVAGHRIKQWGGEPDSKEKGVEKSIN